jgi:large subunit ribosomal protein L13
VPDVEPARSRDVVGLVAAGVDGRVPGPAAQGGEVAGAVAEDVLDLREEVGAVAPAMEEGGLVAAQEGLGDQVAAEVDGPAEDEQAHAGRRYQRPGGTAGGDFAWRALSSAVGRAPVARLPHVAMKTYVATPATRERNWLLVDAAGLTLGRLATQIADALRGKTKPEYTPHCDTGDFVVVINAEKISVSGNKRAAKIYYRHSGYPGGLKERTLQEMLDRRPEEVIRIAVKGMLPRNRLARKQLTKLKVYAGPDHPHAAQKPTPMEVES